MYQQKPSSMPQTKYSSMTKSERRKLPDIEGRDKFIKINGYPRLDLMFYQVQFKTPAHAKEHGLFVDEATGKTPDTEEYGIALRDALIDMAKKQNIVWYPNGQYQGGTPKACKSVNLFDPDTRVITVYEKQPDGRYMLLTTCTLTPTEIEHLKDIDGNFLTEKMINKKNG